VRQDYQVGETVDTNTFTEERRAAAVALTRELIPRLRDRAGIDLSDPDERRLREEIGYFILDKLDEHRAVEATARPVQRVEVVVKPEYPPMVLPQFRPPKPDDPPPAQPERVIPRYTRYAGDPIGYETADETRAERRPLGGER
jgi:hypothetical protein